MLLFLSILLCHSNPYIPRDCVPAKFDKIVRTGALDGISCCCFTEYHKNSINLKCRNECPEMKADEQDEDKIFDCDE